MSNLRKNSASYAAGVNNAYLITTRHRLATLYNDSSVLENSHVSHLYDLVKTHPESDIFEGFSNELWRFVRKLIINSVIHTDMTYHFPMVAKVRAHARPQRYLKATLLSRGYAR